MSKLLIFGVVIAPVFGPTPMFRQTLVVTLRQWRLLLLLFLLTLLPALPPALSLRGTLMDETNGSLAPLQLLPGFSYTVFADFMHRHDGSAWALIRTGLWTMVLSLLIQVWTKGGILHSFANGFRADAFWRAGTHYLLPNGRLLLGNTVVWGLFWLVALLLAIMLLAFLSPVLTTWGFTERGEAISYMLTGGLFTLALAYLLCVVQYASVLLYTIEPIGSREAFRRARRFIALNRRATFGPYLLFMLLGAGVFGVYFVLESLFSAHNWPTIGLLFLLQQLFVFSRVALTTWSLRLAYENVLTLPMPIRLFLPAPGNDSMAPAHRQPEAETTEQANVPGTSAPGPSLPGTWPGNPSVA